MKSPAITRFSLHRRLLLLAFMVAQPLLASAALRADRCAFIGLTNFAGFTQSAGPTTNEVVLTSPVMDAPINWDELVTSWNVPPGVYLTVEARAIFREHTTKYFMLDSWSDDLTRHKRESNSRQQDKDGTVKVDTLVLEKHGGKVQLRITLGGPHGPDARQLQFLGLSFCDSAVQPAPRAPNQAAWGKTIEVPERRQGEYAGGGGWCSPTSLSMVLAYWSTNLNRPELNHTVPETAQAINDAVMDGTGNWPFNTAYAGQYPGIRAYVTRFDDITELEDWIAAGVAPIVSVSSYLTRNRTSGRDSGHLIVCVGFTKEGDVIANDPGVSVKENLPARRVYPRERFINAWKKSKNAVYLIYPLGTKTPADPLHHWDDAGQ